MDVCLHSHLKGGRKRTFTGVSCRVADRMFEAHKQLLDDPFVTYYRVTLEDPYRGGYRVRDTDWEVHGIGGNTPN